MEEKEPNCLQQSDQQRANPTILPLVPSTDTRKLKYLSASSKHIILGHLSPANCGIIFDSKQEASHDIQKKEESSAKPFFPASNPQHGQPEGTLAVQVSNKYMLALFRKLQATCWAMAFWCHHQPSPCTAQEVLTTTPQSPNCSRHTRTWTPPMKKQKAITPKLLCYYMYTFTGGGNVLTNLLVSFIRSGTCNNGVFLCHAILQKHNSPSTRQQNTDHKTPRDCFPNLCEYNNCTHFGETAPHNGEGNPHIRGAK
jgi:hypothetical protein